MVQLGTLMVFVLGAIVVGLPVFSPMLGQREDPRHPPRQQFRSWREIFLNSGIPASGSVAQGRGVER